ncbi:uncharacterized protein LOC108834314 [Raphanus sativus]|uniref:Uncharacterized protein LOC108834314 n=1 Tax=Raphanus sativus TaxID=3726 RepID=A0A9W3DCW7_RAPSA|nr:uncharacterized protein LOC108834314 [Raphanus sativus]
MDVTSNEILKREAVSETLTKGTGTAAYYIASVENAHSPRLSCAVSVGDKRKRNEHGGGSNDDSSAGLKFNDFEKLRKEVNFAVGQTWALYDKVDGMPRLYARIRKVSAPSFELRITNLEPDPDDERDILWFEQDLPVSAGQFRLGKNENIKDCSMFSHVIHCKEGNNSGHITVSPRKGDTWALFKNWDINWSSQPDSHRSYEYEIVEILSDYADGTGVSVAFLHKAKGFASVFFRMGTGGHADMFRVPTGDDADTSQILPQDIYRFSHMIPSFKMTGFEAKGLPKDAYELDPAALPKTIEEKTVPPHLIPRPKPEALCFPSKSKGKVFQTGQFWAFSSHYDYMPRSYCRIQKITVTQAFEQEPEIKMHVCRLKPTPFPEGFIRWLDKSMPVGCGTFSVPKTCSIFTPGHVSHQIFPQPSKDGTECTILPKIGQVWVIYRSWFHDYDVKALEGKYMDYEVVEVLDDGLNYKVLALTPVEFPNEETNRFFRAAKSRPSYRHEVDGTGVIFTIPQSKMIRFSHQIPASRVTKEIDGEMEVLFEVDNSAVPYHCDL